MFSGRQRNPSDLRYQATSDLPSYTSAYTDRYNHGYQGTVEVLENFLYARLKNWTYYEFLSCLDQTW